MIQYAHCRCCNCFFYPQVFFHHFCLKTIKLKSNWSFRLSKCIFQSRYRRESIWSKSTRRHNCLWVSKATLFCLTKQTNHKSLLIGQCGRRWLHHSWYKETKIPISELNLKVKLWNVNAKRDAVFPMEHYCKESNKKKRRTWFWSQYCLWYWVSPCPVLNK